MLPARCAARSEAIQAGLVSALQVPGPKRFQRFHALADEDVPRPEDRGADSTIVEISLVAVAASRRAAT